MPRDVPLPWAMSRLWVRCQQETLGEQVRVCPATHLALEHLQPIDLAFTRSLTPGARAPGLHGGIIRTPSFGNASEGRESAHGGPCQPWITLGRLTPADEAGAVLRERHGLRQFGRLRGQRRQLVVLPIRGPRRRTQDQPGGPARGEPAPRGLCHCRQRLSAPALPGHPSLCLTQAPDIQGHHPIVAPKALATDGPEEMRAIPTAAVPPGQEGRLVRVEEAVVAARARWALGERRALEVPPHGTPTEACGLRDGVQRPPLRMIGPDLMIMGPPSGPSLAGQACRRGGRLGRGEWHRGEAGAGGRVGGVVQRRGHGAALGIDPRELWGLSPAHVGQHLRQMVPPRKAVCHLAGRGCPEARRLRLCLRALPHNHRDAGMGRKPLRHARGLATGEAGPGPPPGAIHQEGPIGMALAQGELLDAEDLRREDLRAGGATDQPQQRVPADREAKGLAQPRPRRPPERKPYSQKACRPSQRPPRPGRHQAGPPLGKGAAGAWPMMAEQLADTKPPGHAVAPPGESGARAGVMTVETSGGDLASRAAGCGLCRSDQEGDPGVRLVKVPGVQVGRCRLGQGMSTRVSHLHSSSGVHVAKSSS
jgi:hypothetical protein